MHEAYRSLPGTPVGIDPRGTGTMGFDVGDYFSGNPRLGPGVMRPRSPFPIDYEHDNGLARNRPYGPDQESWKEEIWRRDNKLACLLNGAIPPYAKYGLVHPMRGKDGEYPADFRHPKTVDTMRVLDNSQLDRIMQVYCLPLDLRPINPTGSHTRESTSSSRVRQAKLQNLLEYLGAYQLLEFEKLKRGLQY
ncbi:MAG: hypothetical protein LQ351_003104 [Letrouitia transgressa]|nr:MAG: hypothetical protein LQ351_003104 [Letrouitia transgressa]